MVNEPTDIVTKSSLGTLSSMLQNYVSHFSSKKKRVTCSSAHDMIVESLMSTAFATTMASEPLAVAIFTSVMERLETTMKPRAYEADNAVLLSQVYQEREDATRELLDALKTLRSEVVLSKIGN